MSDSTGYACDVACPKCGARIGEGCTFKHWDTGQRIATFYCRERYTEQARLRTGESKP